MFVHAREADSPTNMRYMGLLVDKYVPDTGKAKGSSWAGVGSHSLPPFLPLTAPAQAYLSMCSESLHLQRGAEARPIEQL